MDSLFLLQSFDMVVGSLYGNLEIIGNFPDGGRVLVGTDEGLDKLQDFFLPNRKALHSTS
jgi:hypothetical protein